MMTMLVRSVKEILGLSASRSRNSIAALNRSRVTISVVTPGEARTALANFSASPKGSRKNNSVSNSSKTRFEVTTCLLSLLRSR